MKSLLQIILILCIGTGCTNNNDELVEGFEYIRHGTSYGFCVGYCQQNIKITESELTLNRSSWYQEDKYPEISKTFVLPDSIWKKIKTSLDVNSFFNTDTIHGCPDCADGGAEFIEIKTKTKLHKVLYEAGNPPKKLAVFAKELQQVNNLTSVKYDIETSIDTWEKLKKKHQNSYAYTIEFISWSGFGNRTTIEVKNGVVFSRRYQEFLQENATVKPAEENYYETGSELGKNPKGAPLKTIDELYETCLGSYLTVDPATHSLSFYTNDLGIIRNCGYYPKNCIDDCFQGVSISKFSWLTKK